MSAPEVIHDDVKYTHQTWPCAQIYIAEGYYTVAELQELVTHFIEINAKVNAYLAKSVVEKL